MPSVIRTFTWWKIILGVVLIYINANQLLHPEKRTFQPSTAGEANAMLGMEVILIVVGAWLMYSGTRTGTRKPLV